MSRKPSEMWFGRFLFSPFLRVAVFCCLSLISPYAIIAQAPKGDGRRPLLLSDLWSLRSIDLVQISPNGEYVLFAVSAAQPDSREEFKLLHLRTGGIESIDLGQNYYLDARRNHDVVWTRDSDGLLFSERLAGKISIWQWDLSTKTSTNLFTHDSPSGSSSGLQFAESADGKRIAFVTTATTKHEDEEKRKVDTMAANGLVLGQENGKTLGYLIPNEVWIWDRATRLKHLVYTGPVVTGMKWSPDGTKLALQCLVRDKVMIWSLLSPGGNEAQNIVILDLQNGTSQKLRETPLQVEWILGWSPDSRSLAVDSESINRVAESDAGTLGFATGYTAREWKVDPQTGRLNETEKVVIANSSNTTPRVHTYANADAFQWHTNGSLYYSETTPGRTNGISRASPSQRGRTVSDLQWNLSKISFAESAELGAAVCESANEPPELAVVDLRSGKVSKLTSINSLFSTLERPRVERYPVTNRFHYITENWLIKPPNYESGKKYPLVILLYNFNNVFAAQPWMKNFAPFEYSRQGMIVLLANYPNYDGADVEGVHTLAEKWRFGLAVNPLASFEATTDQLVKEGLVDPLRVAICGFSYGGFLTQYAITHSTKFSTAFVNDGGGWNPLLYYLVGMQDSADLLIYDYAFGGSPFGAGATIMRDFLPAYRFGHLAIPVLFEGHGGADEIPAYADFYLTARQEGTPIEAIVYKDRHVMVDRHRQLSSISRSTDWLTYWLLAKLNPAPLDKDEYARWAELRKKLNKLKKASG